MKHRTDYISKKKSSYPITDELAIYLKIYNRIQNLEISYGDLNHYSSSVPLYDKNGKDTLWETLLYKSSDFNELSSKMIEIYTVLKAGGSLAFREHLGLDRIDYCTYGNTKPFRIKIINKLNDNYDYFYVKKVDASRIYGLELEHLLSPSRINYLVKGNTIIEEHIAGIPGDQFIEEYLTVPTTNKVRIAKEFVKFNERCFVRLLGDMRSYNYVIDITPDFDNEQYRIKAIDFDQQNYEGKRVLYLPQFIKENNAIVKLCMSYLTKENVEQYQLEERALMRRRALASSNRLHALMTCLVQEPLSSPKKIDQLSSELCKHFNTKMYLGSLTMGELLKRHLNHILELDL